MPSSGILRAFLDDVVAQPDDPSLWLIMADWLEERGDPRGELVRRTWQLQYEAEHPDFKTREGRVQTLLTEGIQTVRPRRALGGIEFAWIHPGSFLMGSPDSEKGRDDNEQQHRVTLTAGFWMGIYPVTQEQWQKVMGDNPSDFSRTGRGKDAVKQIGEADLARFPVENVSWDLAQEFCAKLSERLSQGVSLPTEAQWEYACRAGTTSPFHFGAVLNGRAAHCCGKHPYGTKKKGPSLSWPTVVGSYPPTAWGLCDMHGNVWELCQDNYEDDRVVLGAIDPFAEPQADDGRVLRGGMWGSYSRQCRSASRQFIEPENWSNGMGLRVGLSP
jgi:uncharacterized protein (TIGR02996 family)